MNANDPNWNYWHWTTSTGGRDFKVTPGMTLSTSPISPVVQERHLHRPLTDPTCAMADRAADEQIAMYEAELKAPCPKCGHVKTYDEDGNLA